MNRTIYGHPDYGAAFLKIEDDPSPLGPVTDYVGDMAQSPRAVVAEDVRAGWWARMWRSIQAKLQGAT